MLGSAMVGLCADAGSMATPVESLVAVLKSAWIDSPKPEALSDEQWHERYASAREPSPSMTASIAFSRKRPHGATPSSGGFQRTTAAC